MDKKKIKKTSKSLSAAASLLESALHGKLDNEDNILVNLEMAYEMILSSMKDIKEEINKKKKKQLKK